MAAINDADISVDTSGNIRWTGAATANRHTVLEFIQWLMLKQDDDQAAGDDLLDITVDTPFDRSTDQIVSLNTPFNIDDTFALHLYNGSLAQNDGDDLYSGLNIIGPVEIGTEYMILQDGKVLASFWGIGINPEASPSLVFSRHLVKSREGGADIDGKRITVLARELGDQFRRFPVTLGTGNSVAAIGNGADIFNTTIDSTLAGYTTIINTEGFQELNIDGTGASGQEFYSQWDTGSQTINDTYERTKWISQRSHVADQTGGSPIGADFLIDNATTVGTAQSFIPPTTTEQLVEVRAQIKILAGSPIGVLYAELYDSDDVASQLAKPTGSALMRSEDVLASHITSAYEEVIFRFNRLNPSTGGDQRQALPNSEYFIVFRHPLGTAGDNFSVEGSSTDQDANMNQAVENPAATWTASATSDLNINVKTSPIIHGGPGEQFEGISIEVEYDGETGAGILEDDIAIWGTYIIYDGLSGTFTEGEYVRIEESGVLVSGGKILYDDGVNDMVVALENPSASVIGDNDDITGIDSGATCKIVGSPTDEDLGGGEGLVLADDDNAAIGELYLQVISGVNPVGNNRIRSASSTDPLTDYVDANVGSVGINNRTISPEFLGTSTGSNIIGSYGIGFVPGDVGASDLFKSLDNTSRQPPNNVVFTVSGLVASEDRVLVGPRTGSALEKGQFLLDGALTGGAVTSILIKDGAEDGTPLSDDIPQDGTTLNTRLRVQMDTGVYRRQAYTSWLSSTFTIPSTSYSGANQAADSNDVFIAFIDVLADSDTETYTGQYVGDRNLFVRVRDGGGTPIKTFEAITAQFLSTPQTVAATRTPDA